MLDLHKVPSIKSTRIYLLIFSIAFVIGCGTASPSSPEIEGVVKSGKFIENVQTQIYPIFNCQSQVQNTVIVERSRTLEQSVHLDFNSTASRNTYIDFIGSFNLAIGGSYGWTNGEAITDSSALQLNAGPKSYPVYTIVWREQWEQGYVKIISQNGIEQIPYRFLSEAHPEINNVKYIDCTPSGFATATALAKVSALVLEGNPQDWLPSIEDMPDGMELIESKVLSNEDFSKEYSDPVGAFSEIESWGRITGYDAQYAPIKRDCDNITDLAAIQVRLSLYKDSTGALQELFESDITPIETLTAEDAAPITGVGEIGFSAFTDYQTTCGDSPTQYLIRGAIVVFQRYNVAAYVGIWSIKGTTNDADMLALVTRLAQLIDLRLVASAK